MSLDATRWAWQQELTPSQKLILLSLADRANEKHECFPSNIRLVEDTGLHRETIFKNIKEMENMGILSVQRAVGLGNKFTLIGVSGREKNKQNSPKTTSTVFPTSTDFPSTSFPTTTSTVFPTNQYGFPDNHQYGFTDSNLPIESTINLPIEPTSKKTPDGDHFLIGNICKSLISNFQIDGVNPSNPKMIELVKAGASLEEFENMAKEIKIKKFNYLLTAMINARVEAENLSRQMKKGAFMKTSKMDISNINYAVGINSDGSF